MVVADLGVAAPLPAHPDLRALRIGPGTREHGARAGDERAEALARDRGGDRAGGRASARTALDLIGTGEMGIGNTTAASAMVAAFTGAGAAEVTGRGTGVDDAGWRRKVAAIERALASNRP